MADTTKKLQNITLNSSLMLRTDDDYVLVIKPTTEVKKTFDMLARSIYHYGHSDNDFTAFTTPPPIYFPGDVYVRDDVRTKNGTRAGTVRAANYRAYSQSNGFMMYQGDMTTGSVQRGHWGATNITLYNTSGYSQSVDNRTIALSADNGSAHFWGTLRADGATTLGGNTTIDGTLNVSGNLTAGSITGFSVNHPAGTVTNADNMLAGGMYCDCTKVSNLPYSTGSGELYRIGNIEVFIRISNYVATETWYRFFLNSKWQDWESLDKTLKSRVDSLENYTSISLSNFITPATGVTIPSGVIRKTGNRIHGYFYNPENKAAPLTFNDYGRATIGTIKEAYRPSLLRVCSTEFNGSTNGSYPYPGILRIETTGVVTLIVDHEKWGATVGSGTSESGHYGWTNGTAFDYML